MHIHVAWPLVDLPVRDTLHFWLLLFTLDWFVCPLLCSMFHPLILWGVELLPSSALSFVRVNELGLSCGNYLTHLSLWLSLPPSVCEKIMVGVSTGNPNYWRLCGFVCIWECRNVRVDTSDRGTRELICMISSVHMINIYICLALVSCLTWDTLAVQNSWHVCPHSSPIMTIYMTPVYSGDLSNIHIFKLSSATSGRDRGAYASVFFQNSENIFQLVNS